MVRRVRFCQALLWPDTNQLFAEIAALQHLQKCLWCSLQAFGNRFAVNDATVSDLWRDLGQEITDAVVMIRDDKAFNFQTL